MKIAVVCAAFTKDIGREINLPTEQPEFDNVSYHLFTNIKNSRSTKWSIYFEKLEGDPRLAAREVKTCIHKFVPDADYWLWIDSNCLIKRDPRDLLKYVESCDIAVMPHPERSNIIEEAQTIFKWKNDQSKNLQFQIDEYYKEGYIPSSLYETKVLLRRNTEKIRKFNELWWDNLKNYSIRDQISFPYVAWKTKTFINTFPGNNSLSEYRHLTKPYIPYWGDIIRI